MTSSLHPVATLLPATRRMVTKYRDRELQMTCSPQKFPQARKSVALTEHVACPLVCAQFRDGRNWARAVARDDRHVTDGTTT